MSSKPTEGTPHRKGSGISVRHGISCGSNKYIIKKLEQQLQEGQQLYSGLAEQNASLRAKEAVLLENVSSQSDNLHYLGLAIFQEPYLDGDGGKAAGITQTLLKDVQVAELLKLVGSKAQPDEPYTSQCMRRAFTPERVEAVRNMSLQQVAEQLQRLTMKLAIVLQHTADDAADEQSACLLSYTLDDVVDEYTELAMLLHVVQDKANLELGTLNLDTVQRQEPPPEHWKRVGGQLKLRPDQIKHILSGFQVFNSKTAPLVAEIHVLGSAMQSIANGSSQAYSSHPVTAANSHSNAPLAGQQQPPGAGTASAADDQPMVDAAVTSIANWSLRSSDGMPDFDHVPDFSENGTSCTKPWQQFGLPIGGLTPEDSEQLDWLSEQLMNKVWSLREVHRTMTFLWLNTLDKRQKAISIVKSYPYWSQPITMCKHLLEEQQQLKAAGVISGSPPASAGTVVSS